MAEKYDKSEQYKKSKSKVKILIIIICLLLLLAGGALGAYFAFKTDDSFEVNYKVKVAATVSGSYTFGEEEKSFGSITFDPKNKEQEANQSLEIGDIKLSSSRRMVTFTYYFENRDTKDIKITLVDNAIKSNIRVTHVIKQGEFTIPNGNPQSGFIVAPNEIWSVELQIYVLDLETDAVYQSTGNNALSWILVGVEE